MSPHSGQRIHSPSGTPSPFFADALSGPGTSAITGLLRSLLSIGTRIERGLKQVGGTRADAQATWKHCGVWRVNFNLACRRPPAFAIEPRHALKRAACIVEFAGSISTLHVGA